MAAPLEPVLESIQNSFRIPNSQYTNEKDIFEVWTPAPIKVEFVQQHCEDIFPEVANVPLDFENAHSCSYCEKIICNPNVDAFRGQAADRKYSSFSALISYSITEIYDAGMAGCLFFGTLFAHGGSHVVDPRQRNLSTIENPLERFVAKWGQGQLNARFSTARDDFGDVQDVHFQWLHRKVPGVDDRYSCRVPRPEPGNWDIVALKGTEAAKWLKSRPVNLDIGSDASFEAARQYLSDCHATHKTCGHDQSEVPSRLVELVTDSATIKLIDTHGKPLDYCALSYCWGGEQLYKTTTSNLEAYQERIQVPEAAKTIQDAITATRNLNIRYIWIDALCIVQDDRKDTIRELSRMPGIYKGAYVTLSAANANSSSEGFLQQRKPAGTTFKLPFKCPDGKSSSVYLYKKPSNYYYGDPINKRAWTLQESVLSPRVLLFGSERLFWQCHTSIKPFSSDEVTSDSFSSQKWEEQNQRAAERFLQSHKNPQNVRQEPVFEQPRDYIERQTSNVWPPSDIKEAMQEWKSLVGQYTQRNLTVSTDKLVALAGIAEEFASAVRKQHPHESAQYSAGLWHFDLPRQLLWKRALWPFKPLSSRPNKYRAPSWSWASIDDAISYQEHCHPLVEILGDQITLKNEELHYGEVNFALLAVVGRVKQARMSEGGTRILDPNMPGFEGLQIASIELDAIEKSKESVSNMPVWLLEAAIDNDHRALGLVLAPARLPDQSAFGGPLPLDCSDINPLNAFSPEHQNPKSDALIHLRRRPTPPLPADDSDWDAGARSDPQYNGYYFRRIGFFDMLVDFREPSQMERVDGEQPSWYAQQHDQSVEHISWFDDCQKRAIFLI